MCVLMYKNADEIEREERNRRRQMKQGGKSAEEEDKKKNEEEARTAIRNKCAARLSYQDDRCIIIG